MAEAVRRRWVKTEVDRALVDDLSQALGVRPATARLLVARGLTTPEQARRYLSPELAHLPDPMAMKHAERAARRIAVALERREKITLYGDYDVDGVTSSALLASFLGEHGAAPEVYIPKRLIEGYGLNEEAVGKIAAGGTKLLITLDCGITADAEIARANEHGLDTIVVDHHRCPPALPPAYAVLNPHQDDCPYPEKVLAAVGVCFNLLIALRKVLREAGAYRQRPEPNLRRLMDLVALGTIADMVPLTGVNRVLVHFGLLELRQPRRLGVRALMDVAGVKSARTSSVDVGFRLGPRINAAGRLADASVGVRLLLSQDMVEARRLADQLDLANGQRQQIEAEVFQQAAERVDALSELPAALVLADPAWHPGVVGIVASKLVERYDRPTVLIGEGGRGSARTARGVHLYEALADVSHHLTKFGGHRAAAGLRIAFDRVEVFTADFLARVLAEEQAGKTEESLLRYDEDLSPEDIDHPLYQELARLEPFGNGNPEPLFRVQGLSVRVARVVGGSHLKLRFAEGRYGGLKAIAFKKGELWSALPSGREVELVLHVELNEFGGFETLEARVRDLRAADGTILGERLAEEPEAVPDAGAGLNLDSSKPAAA